MNNDIENNYTVSENSNVIMNVLDDMTKVAVPCSKSVENSIEILKSNFNDIEMYNYFCDKLVESGSSLEEALIKTEKIFECLKDCATWN